MTMRVVEPTASSPTIHGLYDLVRCGALDIGWFVHRCGTIALAYRALGYREISLPPAW